jgi:hypothetical protein
MRCFTQQEYLQQQRFYYIGKKASIIIKNTVRHGEITDVIFDHNGDFRYLLMIYRVDKHEFLNTKGWTRQYRPLKDFVIEEK